MRTVKRSLNGDHPLVEIQMEAPPLPSQTTKMLGSVFALGKKETSAFLKLPRLTDKSYADIERKLDRSKRLHKALPYLLKSIFRIGIWEGLSIENKPGYFKKQDLFLIGNLARQELAKALLLMSEYDREQALFWWMQIGIKQSVWKRYYFGSLSISRLACGLAEIGAIVRWPTILESCNHRINLLARFRGHAESLCMMINSRVEEPCMSFRVLTREHTHKLTPKEERLVQGVQDFFGRQFRGVWRPVSVSVSSLTLDTGNLTSNPEFAEKVREMVQEVVTDLNTF